ncbi:uncharacterized protein JCM15063_001289 [Sporobolomyces koalae]|uniref:uncharacterized protein n=1 Tax=Sporobolomyces koalae TaxID=500713 RepID=UPI00316D9CF9
MLETLSTRMDRLSTETVVQRILYSCALLGLVSLVGVCVTILPWHILASRTEWISFVLLAAAAFSWLGSIAAMGQLRLDLPKTVKRTSWLLASAALVQVALGILLEYGFLSSKTERIYECRSLDQASTDISCRDRINLLTIAFPIVVAILPVSSIPVLYLLFKQLSRAQGSSHLYLNLGLSRDDVPPGWDVQPQSFAPDSSASDSEDDGAHANKTPRQGDRLSSPKRTQTDGARDSWFELGKREKGMSIEERGRSWSEFRRQHSKKASSRS